MRKTRAGAGDARAADVNVSGKPPPGKDVKYLFIYLFVSAEERRFTDDSRLLRAACRMHLHIIAADITALSL